MVTACMPNLYTHDIDAAVGFYGDRLGFRETFRYPPQGKAEHVVLQAGEALLALSAPNGVSAAGLAPTAGNPFELVVWCADVDGETARLRAAGVEVVVEPYDHVGGHRRAYLTDPDGNWLALVDAR